MPRPLVSTINRTEWITDIQIPTNNTQVALPTNGGLIPNDRFIKKLYMQWEGRITNAGVNNPTGTQADLQYALLDTVLVQGLHRGRGQFEQFINMRGPDLRELALIYQTRAPFSNLANLNLAASATNDLRFIIPIDFTPMNVSLAQQVDWLLDAPNYDALKLAINVADDQNVFTYGTRGAPTFSAFGSGAGNPRIRVHAEFAQAGQSQFAGFVPARLWRYFFEDTSSDITATTTNARMANIPRGYRIRNILVKTGVKSAAVAAGNNSYNTLSNTILANLKIMRGLNKAIRFYADYFAAREDCAEAYSVTPDTGYVLLDFAQHGTWHESVDASGLAAGPAGDTDFYFQADSTGAASQAAVFAYEELRGLPIAP